MKNLKYRTYDQLFEDVSIDFKKYVLNGLIEPHAYIKVARKCNYELGLRIYRTRQVVLEIDNGKVKLPDDFYVPNFLMLCGEYTIDEPVPQGTHIEEIPVPQYQCPPPEPTNCTQEPECGEIKECSADPCTNTCLTKCGQEYQVVQKVKKLTRHYSFKAPINIVDDSPVECDECGESLHWSTGITGRIDRGWLILNVNSGYVYLSYQGDMIDDEGNLLVPDHELINDYYEYALKDRMLENLIMNDEPVGDKYKIVKMNLREARNKAMSLVNTPNFKELQKMWRLNRKAQYHKYYNMFKSHSRFSYKNL